MTELELAVLFHETYERLAPEYGYDTRLETRQFDPATPNGKLMVAVCEQIISTMELNAKKPPIEFMEGTFCKGGQNPLNTSTNRPPAPQGSGTKKEER